jgi:hypothetical protein
MGYHDNIIEETIPYSFHLALDDTIIYNSYPSYLDRHLPFPVAIPSPSLLLPISQRYPLDDTARHWVSKEQRFFFGTSSTLARF